MITKFHCSNCGCEDVSKAEYIDGALGYESILCLICGYTHDENGSYAPKSKNQEESE